jgi:hypothetical protein
MQTHARATSANAEPSRRVNPMPAIIGVLVVLLLARESPGERQAHAQAATPSGGMLNPADQRNEMIAELRRLNARLEQIQQRLDATLTVDVKSMPQAKGDR